MKFPPFLSYKEAEEMILSALPMYQQNGNAALPRLDLSGVRAFLTYLGEPHLKFPSIHIAGTNGKGSVSHMLAAICQNNEYKTGLFTSPHLKSYRERIRINGGMIEESYVLDWVNEHLEYLMEKRLSFFEMSMGLAASYFASHEVEIAIFETGLGGRLDATNVLFPVFTIITHIGLDHQHYLGNTLIDIAGEKAGIIKEGVPVLLGNNLDPSLYPVFESVAKHKNAPVLIARPDVLQLVKTEENQSVFGFCHSEENGETISLPSLAPYQRYNINTVWHACEQMNRLEILSLQRQTAIAALEQFQVMTGFRGRYEIFHKDPLVIMDTTHNVAGLEFYTPLFENKSVHLHLVLALTKERDAREFLSRLPKDATYYFCQLKIPRALEAEKLQKVAAELGMKGEVWEDPGKAINQLILNANKDDIGLILGSIFLVAEIV